jgi:hypothetical protein
VSARAMTFKDCVKRRSQMGDFVANSGTKSQGKAVSKRLLRKSEWATEKRPRPCRARAFTVEAVATLAQIMQDDGQPAAARISAASEILNRGYGKAQQHIDMKATVTIADEFEAFVRELNQPQLISAL